MNGTVESVAFPGKIIASDGASGEAMVLQSSGTASSQQWKRLNTRLLTLTANQSEWKQDWTVSFISSSPHNINLKEFERGNNLATTCYKPNPAFSKAFDDFAKELVIVDPKDEEKCGKVREELGFDKDHPFDTEVREKFHEHMCDPFFTGVDHTGPSLEAPPQFEMLEYTPVEYEAVEYEAEEYQSIDYEEFTRYVAAERGLH